VTVVGEILTEIWLTVNGAPLLEKPFTVTTKLPVVAPRGTVTRMPVLFQLVGVASVPLKVTVLLPCVGPKLVPEMVTEVPTEPTLGDRLLMAGGARTVKRTPLLARPPTVTMTLPDVPPFGTGTTILAALQLVGAAAVPLKVTVLVPCEAPKFAPVIVTEVPIGPEVGERLAMLGVGMTVKATPLLARPLTVTTTFPVVAPGGTNAEMLVEDQLVTEKSAVPLSVTVLEP